MSDGKVYDLEYKIQAVKLANEIGQAKAVAELGIPKSTVFPQQAENRFRVTKVLLAQDLHLMRSRHFLFTLKVTCAIMPIEFFMTWKPI